MREPVQRFVPFDVGADILYKHGIKEYMDPFTGAKNK